MDISANPSSSSSSIVTVKGQTASPVPDEDERSQRIANYLQNLDGLNFIQYMNEIGWPQDGTFVSLLSTIGYDFNEKCGRMVTRKWYVYVACALSVIICELLPFNLPTMQPLPQLPIEIWECIIDWIDVGYVLPMETGALHACTLVCRSWHTRATLNLYRRFEIRGERISNLQMTLRNNSSMFSLPNAIQVLCTTSSISALFIESKFKNLRYLTLADLDLAKEHVLIMRGPLPHSITELKLWNLRPCTVSCMLRFLKSFRCLLDLMLSYDMGSFLRNSGQILPPPYPLPGRSLMRLDLRVVPGVDIDRVVHPGRQFSSEDQKA